MERPVAAVRSFAGLDQPREPRSVIGQTNAPAAFSVADLELDLRLGLARLAGVDRTPGDQRFPATTQVVADMSASLAIDGQSWPGDVTANDRAAESRRSRENYDEQG